MYENGRVVLMPGQDTSIQRHDPPCTDAHLLQAAQTVLRKQGVRGLTLDRLAAAAGTSRMTLHRREVTLSTVLAGLTLRAVAELREAWWPALTSEAPAVERLRQALSAVCEVAEQHLPLLAGLYAHDGGLFHDQKDSDGPMSTRAAFVAPLAKILRDGAADGSLRAQPDPAHTAAVLFNTVGWAYVHLRHAQQWPAAATTDDVLRLVMDGLRSSPA